MTFKRAPTEAISRIPSEPENSELYAIGVAPSGAITSLGASAGKVESVSVLGGASPVSFSQDDAALRVTFPQQVAGKLVALKITGLRVR